jgi:vacuolar protein sorting-associated protein 45
LFFSNRLSEEDHQLISQADQSELVMCVTELYADFLALSSMCAHLLVPSLSCLSIASHPEVTTAPCDVKLHSMHRTCTRPSPSVQAYPPHLIDRLIAVCLTLKRRPTIRFRSKVGRCVAREFQRRFDSVSRDFSSDFKRSDSAPLLLLVDRRDDLITPIIKDWT